MSRLTKNNIRYSKHAFLDVEMAQESGEIFKTPSGDWDSSKVKVLHHGIDTLKQLYGGLIINEVLEQVTDFYENHEANSKELFSLGGLDWRVTSGRRGGYRYLLQNKVLGVVVLLGPFYCATSLNGHHLKIELSPHFILSRRVDDIQKDMDKLAWLFITQLVHTGVAVHLCADVQGWTIPNDLDDKLTTRCRRVYKVSASSSMEFDNFGDLIIKYGKGQSFAFGKADSIQFAVYNKTRQLKEVNGGESLPFWQHVWRRDRLFDPNCFPSDADNPDILPPSVYDSEKTVSRLEVRFHHSVIDQFARGVSADMRSFSQVSKHLTGLWRYALNNFRLDATPTYIDAFWQFMRDDLQFLHDVQSFDYIRAYKKELVPGVQPSARSVKVWLGITCKMFKQTGYKLQQAMEYLQNSGVWQWLEYYFQPLQFVDDYEDVGAWSSYCYIEQIVESKLV